MVLGKYGTRRRTERVYSLGFSTSSAWSGEGMARICSTSAQLSRSLSSKAAVCVLAGSFPAVNLCRFGGLVACGCHDEPVGKAPFRK